MPRKLKIVHLLVAAVLLLAACSTGANQTPEVDLPAPEQVVVEDHPDGNMAEEPMAEEAAAEDMAEPAPVQADNGGYVLGLSQGDPNLKATDPTTVNLAAGKPQYVEFFAFW